MPMMQGWLLHLMGFNVGMIRWCSLHTLNLGPLIWACGGALELLMEKALLVTQCCLECYELEESMSTGKNLPLPF